jgi:hypothetical protein
LYLLAPLEVVTKPLVGLRAILKAFQVGLEFSGGLGRKAINHPGSVSGAFDEAVLSQVSEVLRNLCLLKSKDFLKMANAQRSMGKQVNDSKPRRITKALVNSDQVHFAGIAGKIYSSTTIQFDAYFSLVDIHCRDAI